MEIAYREDFKNFMSSKDIYFESQDYWRAIISEYFSQSICDWVDTSYANGQKIEDGNPLFSCKIGDKKAIRIIQDRRNLITPIFASWNSVYDFDGKVLDELVIALQPFKNTYNDALLLITKFSQNAFKKFQYEVNIKYNEATNLNRIKALIRFFEKYLAENKIENEKNSDGDFELNIYSYKKLHELNELLYFYESKFENKDLSKSYKSVVKDISRLNDVITLKNSFDFSDRFDKKYYKKEIKNKFSNYHNYIVSFNSKLNNLENNYNELKKIYEEVY